MRIPKAVPIERTRKDGSTYTRWGIDHEVLEGDGTKRRVRRDTVYKTKKEAEAKARQIYREQNPPQASIKAASLTDYQILDALGALNVLQKVSIEHGIELPTLTQAAKSFRAHFVVPPEGPTLAEVIPEYLDWRKIRHLEKKTLTQKSFSNIRQKLNMLNRFLGTHLCRTVTSEQLLSFFENRLVDDHISTSTLKTDIAIIGEFFDTISSPFYPEHPITENPFDAVRFFFKKQLKGEDGDSSNGDANRVPTILQLNMVKRSLRIAMTDFPEFLPHLVLGLFAGLRPSEIDSISRLEDPWKTIQMAKSNIHISKGIGRRPEVRNIRITPNLVEWLKYLQKKDLPIVSSSEQHRLVFRVFRRTVILDDERIESYRKAVESGDEDTLKSIRHYLNHNTQDCFRHTYGTFLEANGTPADDVVAQMGNSIRTYIRHYKGLLHDPADAAVYWQLTPKSVKANARKSQTR